MDCRRLNYKPDIVCSVGGGEGFGVTGGYAIISGGPRNIHSSLPRRVR